jgi:LDH2 family malate/lactate/ureidoglycolate dehydrogenase
LVVVRSVALSALTQACFERLGLSAGDARAVAEVLVDANLRGNDSHGVGRVPAYMRRVSAGLAGGAERIGEPEGEGPLRRLDAGAALGPIAANRATEIAIGLAREHGLGLVVMGNSTHFGSAGPYARRVAEQGLFAIVATNGPANMAPHGSAEPFLGTNAFAVALPLPGGEQFVLDMSCSIAARGKIIRARDLGEPIEPGTALDARGRATTDAAEALAGAVLPLGGPKGTGLALAISIAVGVLGGASFDDEAGRMHGTDARPQNLGQLFCAVDPWRLAKRDEAERRLAALIQRLHSLPPAPGVDRVLYPGERGDRERRARLEAGIPIADEELEAIAGVCAAMGHADLAQRAHSLASSAAAE